MMGFLGGPLATLKFALDLSLPGGEFGPNQGEGARSVVSRSREFGIRMTLGATRASVLRLVLRDVSALVVAGLAMGSMGAAALAGYLRSMLFAVSPLDPLTFVTVLVLLGTTAALACLLPARRATRITPVEALRTDVA